MHHGYDAAGVYRLGSKPVHPEQYPRERDKYSNYTITHSLAHANKKCLAAPQRVTGRARTPVH